MEAKTIRELRDEAAALARAGVANRDQLMDAVPALVTLQNAAKAHSRSIKKTFAVIRALSDACSAYARRHPDFVFEQTFSVSPIGVESGDIEIDGRTYHFTHGFDGYTRAEQGEKLTQAFLKDLPEGWAKQKLVLDTSAISKGNAGDGDLAEYGLMRKAKDVWFETWNPSVECADEE